jgi:hypothetical protein
VQPGDDAAVYSAVFERLYRGSSVDARPIVLQDSVHAVNAVVRRGLQESLLRLEGVEASTIAHFMSVSETGLSLRELAPAIRASRPVILATTSDLITPQRGAAAHWAHFNTRFPGSFGLVAVSRIGYSRNGDQALVMVTYGNADYANADIAVLRRMNGTWEVVRHHVTVET